MRVFRLLAAGLIAGALALPAFADIKAFNAAVTKGDYKTAAAAAAETWPQLDKNRDDLAIIAREFGFAAVMAEDYASAQTYAQAALEYDARPGVSDALAFMSNELLWLARHKAAPSKTTRQELFNAVTVRAAQPGIDSITYLAVEQLVVYDTKKQDWPRARADDALAVHFMTAGGPSMLLERRKYEVYAATAAYMDGQKFEQFEALMALTEVLKNDMEAAPNDKTAQAFASAYWSASAWATTFRSHLDTRGFRSRLKAIDAAEKIKDRQPRSDRLTTVLGPLAAGEDEPCHLEMRLSPFPKYPDSAEIKGYLSTIVLKVDVDDQGRSSNAKLLASAPLQEFGAVVLKAVPGLTFSPDNAWDPATCKLARKDHVIFFVFTMAH